MTYLLNELHMQWLMTLGYRVAGCPETLVRAMFEREARQWQMTPEELCAFVAAHFEPRPATLHVMFTEAA